MIADCGLSKQLTVEVTSNNSEYIEPQCYRNNKYKRDERSDIYSLGILLYEITTGFVPFKGESYLDVIEEIKGLEPTPILSLREDAPPQLAAVVMKCLSKNPEDRYQSAADLIKDLKAIHVDQDAAK